MAIQNQRATLLDFFELERHASGLAFGIRAIIFLVVAVSDEGKDHLEAGF